MLLRVIRGKVVVGREADFIAICREQVAAGARLPGLAAFFGGYRRVGGVDSFVLASVWDTEADAAHGGGEPHNPRIVQVTAGVATIESVDYFTVFEPVFRGIVDAPGGVIRLTTARVLHEGREAMLSWLRSQPRERATNTRRLLLGWALAERDDVDRGGVEVMAISAWPSPLVIEAVSDPGRMGAPLYADLDSFTDDATVEQFRAISLELPESLADIGSRRVIAARFASADAANAAANGLAAALATPKDAHITVAPLGAPGAASDPGSFVLVARVAIDEFGRAERLIADEGGDVILSQLEVAEGRIRDGDGDGVSLATPSMQPDLSTAQ